MLLWFWHFTNNEAATESDRIFKMRLLVKLLQKNFKKIMKPDLHMAVDESMVPFRGRLKFKQYIPNKRHKYDIKLFKMSGIDSYTYTIMVYEGKHNVDGRGLATLDSLLYWTVEEYSY